MKDKIPLIILFAILVLIFILAFTLPNGLITSNVISETLNLRAEIPHEYQNIKPGDKLWFTTRILNLANQGRVDVTLKYTILENGEKEIATKSETVAIETQASFVGNILVPQTASTGKHTLKIQMITANGDISDTETSFNIIEEKNFIAENYLYFIIATAIILTIIILIQLKKPTKKFIERRKLKQKIKNLIKSKIKNKEITKEELKNSKIEEKPKAPTKEEKKYY